MMHTIALMTSGALRLSLLKEEAHAPQRPLESRTGHAPRGGNAPFRFRIPAEWPGVRWGWAKNPPGLIPSGIPCLCPGERRTHRKPEIRLANIDGYDLLSLNNPLPNVGFPIAMTTSIYTCESTKGNDLFSINRLNSQQTTASTTQWQRKRTWESKVCRSAALEWAPTCSL